MHWIFDHLNETDVNLMISFSIPKRRKVQTLEAVTILTYVACFRRRKEEGNTYGKLDNYTALKV